MAFIHETQASEPLGDSRKHSLFLSNVERPGQGTEPLDTRLCSSWKPSGQSPVSALLWPDTHSLPQPLLPLSAPLCPYDFTLTHLTHADT